MVLLPPVEPMKAAKAVQGPGVLRDPAYGQKFDGRRPIPFTQAEPGGCVLL
ncbi:hypothetical protein [Streptomyces sp. WM6372]|uniref:hypothetical protein n=1 Tax=Streptomyces sp. WM6372 TaxID=1415555 RepID=UPI000ACB87F5|nr:hypothetical protein [Streptomyces sp. WM6372]